jgi:molecular chaperone HscC
MALCGIDLGTTNSLIAVYTESGPNIVPNGLGQALTPSAVSVLEDGTALVGSAAKDRLITHPEDSAASFKRLMGSARGTKLKGIAYRPEELSAFVLRSLKEDAERYLGVSIDDVVISVPAYFNDIQRKATIDAGRLAGFTVKRLINEPTAAALAYGLSEVDEAKFLIFDLGGGTFDVSILDKFEGVLEVRATTGDSQLGGDDFTSVTEKLVLGLGRIEAGTLSATDRAKLRAAAETLKCDLSRETESTCRLALSGGEICVTMTRSQFEEAAAPLLRRLREPIERAVRDAQMQPGDIHSIVMVGGATRMPMVRSLVARLFGRMPLIHLDPDRIVAQGAAIQAALMSRNEALDDVVMTDVCPFTLGVAAQQDGSDGLFVVPIIERNAIVPISRNHPFTTVRDKQSKLTISVYQGENIRPDTNILIGELTVDVPPNKAGHESVDVRFTYDVSGALEVEVASLSTGERKTAIFRNNSGLSEQEIATRFKSLSEIKLHPREQLPNKALLARAERLYTQHLGETRTAIASLIQQFQHEILSQRNRDLEAVRQNLARALDHFERSIFQD